MSRALLLVLTLIATCLIAAPVQAVGSDAALPPVIGIPDTGINPYHLEFSAERYPDAAVLALTAGFTRHPSEYIPGYPADAIALELTLGDEVAPAADAAFFEEGSLEYGQLYWIPGTKIVGLQLAAPEQRFSSEFDEPILGSRGPDVHGTGSASVAAGNTLGTCPTCLLFFQQALDSETLALTPWVDITSHSFFRANDNTAFGPDAPRVSATRAAAQRGQITLFGGGNGQGTPFLLPLVDGQTSQDQGPSWVVQVGGVDRRTGRPLLGDQVSVKVSSYAVGDIPAAAGNSVDGQRNYGGTSAATPITAGVVGRVLHQAREAVHDRGGPRPDGVVAAGTPVADSPSLADGALTRAELLRAVLKTAMPLTTDNTGYQPSTQPQPPYHAATNVYAEGYGVVDEASAERAIEVLLGRAPLPDRPYEDAHFERDRTVRDQLWGPCGCADERSESTAGDAGRRAVAVAVAQ